MSADENNVFTKAEVEAIAQTAADRAIASLFDKLDIDVSKKDALINLRENLIFLDDQRQGSMVLKQHVKKSAVYLAGTAALGIVYLSWDALKIGFITMLQQLLAR